MNDYWNNNGKNHQVGKCNVNFNIKVLANPNPKNVMNNVVVLNKNALVPAEFTASGNNEGRAFVRNGSVGYIYVNNSSAVVAHEAGHLMYADDHYIDNVGPKFGWEYTLMGDPYNVNASTIQDITDVLTNNNKLSECACK